MNAAPTRVLICDDSRTYAAALSRMLEHDGDIAVARVCTSAEQALADLERVRPDLVTMDIELPGMDGLRAVEQIMSSRPVPILVLSAHLRGDGRDRAAAALGAGALEAVAKDGLDLRDPGAAAGAVFRHRVKVLSRAHVIHHPRANLKPAAVSAAVTHPRPVSVIGVVASTGGPQLLAAMVARLPRDYPIPLVVVQHIAEGFIDGLARLLDDVAPLPVRIAGAGEHAEAGVWLAPEGTHLTLDRSGRFALDRRELGAYRPSGDALLESLAHAAGSAAAAVVLTGMGRDGAAGAAAVKAAGGLAVTQDESSSAIFGMPKAAVDHGIDVVLAPDGIVALLKSLRHRPLRDPA